MWNIDITDIIYIGINIDIIDIIDNDIKYRHNRYNGYWYKM